MRAIVAVMLLAATMCGCLASEANTKPKDIEYREIQRFYPPRRMSYLPPALKPPDFKPDLSNMPFSFKFEKIGSHINECSDEDWDGDTIIWSSNSGVYDEAIIWGKHATDWNGNLLWDKKVFQSLQRIVCPHLVNFWYKVSNKHIMELCDLRTGKTVFSTENEKARMARFDDTALERRITQKEHVYICPRCNPSRPILRISLMEDDAGIISDFKSEMKRLQDQLPSLGNKPKSNEEDIEFDVQGSENHSPALTVTYNGQDGIEWQTRIYKKDLPLARYYRNFVGDSNVRIVCDLFVYDNRLVMSYYIPDIEWAWHGLACLEATTGKVLWIADLPPKRHDFAYIEGCLVYVIYGYEFPTTELWLVAQDIDTGELKAIADISDKYDPSMSLLAKGNMLVFNSGGSSPNPKPEVDLDEYMNPTEEGRLVYGMKEYGVTSTDLYKVELLKNRPGK